MSTQPHEAKWQSVTSALTEAFDTHFGVMVLSNVCGNTFKPIIQAVSVGKYRLIIPLGVEAGSPVVAVGTFDANPREVLDKLLALVVRSIHKGSRHADQRLTEEQRLDIEAYARQTSRNFEELNWLCSQLESLTNCDASNSAKDNAQAVLLPLCPLIGAEGILLVSADREQKLPGQQTPLAGQVVAKVGPEPLEVDDDGCCGLINQLREIAISKPLVQNGMHRRREFSMAPGVHSCILVPVNKQNRLLGWLLAVNHSPRSTASEASAGEEFLASPDDGFGTSEANLAASAAAMLALDPSCPELFGENAGSD